MNQQFEYCTFEEKHIKGQSIAVTACTGCVHGSNASFLSDIGTITADNVAFIIINGCSYPISSIITDEDLVLGVMPCCDISTTSDFYIIRKKYLIIILYNYFLTFT